METTEITDLYNRNRTYGTNWMLDDIIKAFDAHRNNEDDLIKALTIQKIEYGRTCSAQIVSLSGQTPQTMKCFLELDAQLQKIIQGLGGNPISISIINPVTLK